MEYDKFGDDMKGVIVLLILLTLTGCVDADWWNTSYAYCQNITINNELNYDLSDFPAYVNLSYTDGMQTDFSDVVFVDSTCGNDASILAFELENYTDTNAHYWVKVDIDANPKRIGVYYGNDSVDSLANPTGVWNSSFEAVYHFPSGDSLSDTTGQNDLTSNATNVSYYIDGGIEFVETAHQDTSGGYTGFDEAVGTVEIWFKPLYTNTIGLEVYDYLVSHYDSSTGDRVYIILQDNYVIVRLGDMALTNTTYTLGDTNWHYLVLQWNSGTGYFYADGVQKWSDSYTGLDEIDNDFNYFSGSPTNTNSYEPSGNSTEVRVSSSLRSADYINQSYQMVANQPSMVSFGAEETQTTTTTSTTTTTLCPDCANLTVFSDDGSSDSVTLVADENSTATVEIPLDATVKYARVNASGFKTLAENCSIPNNGNGEGWHFAGTADYISIGSTIYDAETCANLDSNELPTTYCQGGEPVAAQSAVYPMGEGNISFAWGNWYSQYKHGYTQWNGSEVRQKNTLTVVWYDLTQGVALNDRFMIVRKQNSYVEVYNVSAMREGDNTTLCTATCLGGANEPMGVLLGNGSSDYAICGRAHFNASNCNSIHNDSGVSGNSVTGVLDTADGQYFAGGYEGHGYLRDIATNTNQITFTRGTVRGRIVSNGDYAAIYPMSWYNADGKIFFYNVSTGTKTCEFYIGSGWSSNGGLSFTDHRAHISKGNILYIVDLDDCSNESMVMGQPFSGMGDHYPRIVAGKVWVHNTTHWVSYVLNDTGFSNYDGNCWLGSCEGLGSKMEVDESNFHLPTDLKVAAGDDASGSAYTGSGELSTEVEVSGFEVSLTDIVNTSTDNCTCDGCSVNGDNCTVPLKLLSTTLGGVTLDDLLIQYDLHSALSIDSISMNITNNSDVLNGAYIRVSANYTNSTVGIDSAYIEVDGSTNYSTTITNSTYIYLDLNSSLLSLGSHNVTAVYANDTSGWVSLTALYTFEITEPDVELSLWNGTDYSSSASLVWRCSVAQSACHPTNQNVSVGVLNITNNGTATGDLQIKINTECSNISFSIGTSYDPLIGFEINESYQDILTLTSGQTITRWLWANYTSPLQGCYPDFRFDYA